MSLVFSSSEVNQIPSCSGVYAFYGSASDSVPLYIGKSIDLKKRVKSHYYQAKSQSKEKRMMSQVRSISVDETAGELGALLLEASLIKIYRPIFNRRLRIKYRG